MSVILPLSIPRIGPDTLTARPYQVEAIQACRREFAAGRRSTLVIHPTGLGKTVFFSKVSRAVVEKGGRVLILAHRGELIEQAVNTLERVGIMAGIEKAESRARSAWEPDVVVGTVQTMQRARLESWPEDFFKLIVVDECHHASATTYQTILRHFHARVLGVTATPDRADEDKLSDIFESVAHELTIWEAITAPPPGPWLCRLQFVQCDVGIDLRDIRTTGGDYNAADLETVIAPLMETLCNAVRQEIGRRQTLIFTPDVGSAQAAATAMQAMGLKADWVAGDSPDRRYKIEMYREGQTQILSNCNLLTEGFDAPRTAAIVLLRPTKSRNLFSQMIGRGTRLHDDKTDCLIVDFDYLTNKHELVRPADLFDSSDTDPEVLQIADEMLRKGEQQDLLDVIEKARAKQQERQVLRVQARERDIQYRRVSYDPLAVADTLGVAMRGSPDARHDPPSPKQVETLRKFGMTGAETLSRRRASRMLDVLITRSKKGKATLKQVQWLIAKGIDPFDARAMTKDEASARLDQFFGGRKRA